MSTDAAAATAAAAKPRTSEMPCVRGVEHPHMGAQNASGWRMARRFASAAATADVVYWRGGRGQ